MDLTKTTALADTNHSPLAHEWPLLLMMALILLGGKVFCGASWATTGSAFALYFIMGSVGSALHMSFHVRNFHLEKYEWYMELRTLHYIHHLGDMKSNFAMLNLGMDQACNSIHFKILFYMQKDILLFIGKNESLSCNLPQYITYLLSLYISLIYC